MFIDYYEVLKISQDASFEEVKSAYRRESLRWHPDKNPNIDTTLQMQRVNEAYAILKDAQKRDRYDDEYLKFKFSTRKMSDTHGVYDYDVMDEQVKEDIRDAREYARKLVEEFMASFKQGAMNAAKGSWESMKPHFIGVFILMILGALVSLCSGEDSDYEAVNDSSVAIKQLEAREVINIPSDWSTYSFGSEYELSVPPTVELRNDFDEYTQFARKYNLPLSENSVVFQQKGLSGRKSEAMGKYCRVLIQYYGGANGDFMRKDETAIFDTEWDKLCNEMVVAELGPSTSLMGKIDYCWREVNGQKYIEVKYKRTGANFDSSIPVICKICLFQNSNEMVKMMLSYREQEAALWEKDFELIVKTFKWL